MRYVISYDLITPGKDYQSLWTALAGLGAQRILLSQWAVRRHNTTATGLRDYLWPFLDRNDKLLVTSLDSHDWASMNLTIDLNTM